MITFLRHIKWFVKWLRVTKSLFWARVFSRYKIPPIFSVYTDEKRELHFSNSNLVIPKKDTVKHLVEVFGDLNALALSGSRFIPNTPYDQIELSGLRFNIYNEQSIRILSEVFVNRVYEVSLEGQPVVIDIGMNVGISSLFFAETMGGHVYGYEPFKETYNRAVANIRLNPEISDRIYPFRCGVGCRSRKAEFTFCPDSPGDCGIVRIPEVYRRGRDVCQELVEIVSVTDVLELVLRKESGNDIMLKLDCEGMEFEIIDCLQETGFISNISVVLMEWHRRGNLGDPSALQLILAKSGFVTFGNPSRKSEVGMLLGVNRLNSVRHGKKTKDPQNMMV
jgi:FkbM family methyltransferase